MKKKGWCHTEKYSHTLGDRQRQCVTLPLANATKDALCGLVLQVSGT